MKNKSGFTLIEIMVSLVLVGLIAGIAGTSVITATKSYLFARENNAITQKAQLALNRLNREIIELSNIRDASSTCVVYESPYGRRAVARLGNTVRLFTGYGSMVCPTEGGDVLVDGVQGFSILYNPIPNGTVSLWSLGQDIKNLFVVNIQLVLSRPDTGGTVPFYMTVSPRNNNNSGGAALPTAASPPPEYSGKQCFVTTAAYGDADHPVVETMRLFRDRFLLPTETGRALVRFYYDVGPSLAEAIQDRPVACLFVRLLITPLAGFALLALYCPLLVPLLLLLSWAAARLVAKALARRALRRRRRLQRQHGAMLVTLIAALVVFSALGALMIGMFGTSALSQVAGNSAMKAYYLAESGFRYAAGEYINVTGAGEAAREEARDSLLKDRLHGQSFSLGGDGSFKLDVYAYYFKAIQAPGGNALTARFFGGMPVNMGDMNNPFNAVWMKVQKPGGEITHNRAYLETGSIPGTVILRQVDAGGNAVDWDSGHWDSTSGTGSLITPVCVPDRARRTLIPDSGGYDLAYADIPGILAFPEKNGIFTVRFEGETNPRILAYRQRDIANRRLKGVSDPNGGILPAGAMVDPGTAAPYQNFVELTKFVRLDSTGTIGTGASAVSRKVTYYAPIGYARATPIPKAEFKESFGDAALANWFTGLHGSHVGEQVQSSSIGPALRFGPGAVTKTSGGTIYREGQIGLNWSGAVPPIPLVAEWSRAGNYLSYDAQAKVYFYFTMTKQIAGVTFRLDESGNAMGLSFGELQQGVDEFGRDHDSIPDQIVSSSAITNPVITLWTKQYDKSDDTFTVVSNPGPQGCAGHPDSTTVRYAILSSNSSVWDTGFRVRFKQVGGASLPGGLAENTDYYVRRIAGTDYFYLFDSYSDAIAKDGSTPTPCWTWDRVRAISGPGSGTVRAVNQNPAWTNLAYQALTSGNRNYGLYNMSLSMPVPWATLLVRIIEAPSVSVLSTAGSTGREIASGDTVYTTGNNSPSGSVEAIALVKKNPVYRTNNLTARDWSGKRAEAVLILEPVKDSNGAIRPHVFGQGKTLFAGAEGAGANAGVVNTPPGSTDIVYRDRDQWIAVYVADPTGPDSSRVPDSNPFNIYNSSTGQYQRGRILRTSVRWPVDDVENTVAANDFFTVVRFGSFVNSALPSCRVSGGSGLLELGGTNCLGGFFSKDNIDPAPDMLRFSSPDGVVFNSPSAGTLPPERAEVGLHNYGGNITYFDDFALQFGPGYGITRQGFLLPIQQ